MSLCVESFLFVSIVLFVFLLFALLLFVFGAGKASSVSPLKAPSSSRRAMPMFLPELKSILRLVERPTIGACRKILRLKGGC